jgi:HTH-type transcriptional repressor of puuD
MKYKDDEWSEILTDLRQEAGLTQRRAAIKAGLSQNYVRTIESCKISPTVRNLDKVLNVYGYELEVVKK